MPSALVVRPAVDACRDSRTGAFNYFLTMSATHPDTQSGQGFIAKVAPLGKGV